MDRLTMWDEEEKRWRMKPGYLMSQQVIKRLAAYEDAEAEGRLVVLPCKVGDTIYEPCLGRILERRVASIVIQRCFTVIYCGGSSTSFNPSDFGKTVFLTREEAEAALKGGSNEAD